MSKGIAQSKRNNAWHLKHTKDKAHERISHNIRMLNRMNGNVAVSQAEKNFKSAQQREKTRHVSFGARLKYFSLMARIKTRARMKRLGLSISPRASNA